jgi:tetratricopeptide (TPR) repeat protein
MHRKFLISLVFMASCATPQNGQVPPPSQNDRTPTGVEQKVASKRREQIAQLEKLLSFNPPEAPSLMFRLGELYWEESRFYEFEAQSRAEAEKVELLAKARQNARLAIEQYTKIVQGYPGFERTDEVLFFLGQSLMENGEDAKALVAYERLVKKYPRSRYMPDVWAAFGDYFFNNSQGQRNELERALDAYKRAEEFTESQVYGYALYKQGWCYFNMADYATAKDKFKRVVLYGERANARAKEKNGSKASLVREARADYVRAYARDGDAMQASDDFRKVATRPEDHAKMMRQLADLYSADGKDREAAIINALLAGSRVAP